MTVLFLLLPISLAIASVFLAGFIWAVRSGQFEDTETPAMRILPQELRPQPRAESKITTPDFISNNS